MKLLKNNILILNLFLLLLFINKNNLYGFITLILGLIVFFINKKLSLIFLGIWLFLLTRPFEKFTTSSPTVSKSNNLIDNSNTNFNNRIDNSNTNFNIFLKIDNREPPSDITNPVSVSIDNTFLDIIKIIGDKSGKNYYNYNIAIDLIPRLPTNFDNNNKYILKDEDLVTTFETWNINSEEYNEQNKDRYDENIGQNNLDTEEMKEIVGNYNNLRPIFTSDKKKLYTSDKIYLYKKTDLDRLKYIIKNLTLLNDDTLIEQQLITYNITKVLQLNELKNIFSKENLNQNNSNNKLNQNVLSQFDLNNIKAFIAIYKIYCFQDNKIISLIKRHKFVLDKIESEDYDNIIIKKLKKNRNILTEIEREGIEYYSNQKQIIDKYFDLLDFIKLNENFNTTNIKKIILDKDNYNDYDVIKDIYYILILFTINNVLNDDDLLEENNEGKIRAIENIAKNYSDLFDLNDDILNKYKLREKVTNKLYDLKIELGTKININYDIVNLGNIENVDKTVKNNLYENRLQNQKKTEYNEINKIKNYITTYEHNKNKDIQLIDLDNIGSQFSTTLLDIINDLTDLFSRENYINYMEKYQEQEEEEIDEEEYGNNNTYKHKHKNKNSDLIKIYLYYFKQIAIILTKEGRMFYEGLMFLIVAILMYFIEISK